MLYKSNMSDLIFLDIPLEISEDPTLIRLYREMMETFKSLETNIITEMMIPDAGIIGNYPIVGNADTDQNILVDKDVQDIVSKQQDYRKDARQFLDELASENWIAEQDIDNAVQAELNEMFSSVWATYGLPGDFIENNIIRQDISRKELADQLDAMVSFSKIKATLNHDQLRTLFSIVSIVGGFWSFNVIKLLAGTQKSLPA